MCDIEDISFIRKKRKSIKNKAKAKEMVDYKIKELCAMCTYPELDEYYHMEVMNLLEDLHDIGLTRKESNSLIDEAERVYSKRFT